VEHHDDQRGVSITRSDENQKQVPATDLVAAPNGAITNPKTLSFLEQFDNTEPQIAELAPGVHSLYGFAAFTVAVIEGDSGLIVYDTGETRAHGAEVLDMVRRVSSKPISAVVYSHSHYAHGTATLIDEANGTPVVGHPNVNAKVASAAGSALSGVFDELAPLYQARADEQLAVYLPVEGPDAPVFPALSMAPDGFVPVNRPVQDGEEFELDGVRFQGFTEFWSDEDACLTLYLPDHGVVFNNFLWPFMPNLYPLRGEAFRDPRIWRDGLRLIRMLEPTALHNVVGGPMVGQKQIAEALADAEDALSFVFDQTVRGMLKGLGPEQLRAFVRLPDHLSNQPQLAEIYGEVSVFPPRMFYEAFGWFDRDAANLAPPTPTFEAERIVAGFGGRDAVLAAAVAAIEEEEFAWAARLVNHLYILDPLDLQARELKAAALRALGRRATGSIPRAFYIGQALALEGEASIPTLTIPEATELAEGDISLLVDRFRVFIDPDRSQSVDAMLSITFTDTGSTHGLIVRRGVCEYVEDVSTYQRRVDMSCSMTRLHWAELYTGDATPRALLEAGHIDAGGHRADVVQFLEMFEPLDRASNQFIPRYEE